MTADGSHGDADRRLLAIHVARTAYGSPVANPWLFRLADDDVLRILDAPGLHVHRPVRYRDARLVGALDAPAFSQAEADTGFAGVVICELLRRLRALGTQPASAPTAGDPRIANRLRRVLVELRSLLDEPEVATLAEGCETLSPNMISFDNYKATTAGFIAIVSIHQTGITKTEEAKRAVKHHPEGSALERFIRDQLAPTFEEIYRKRITRTRKNDGRLARTPFVEFATAFYDAIGEPIPASETLIRALSPSAKSRRKGDAKNTQKWGERKRSAKKPPTP